MGVGLVGVGGESATEEAEEQPVGRGVEDGGEEGEGGGWGEGGVRVEERGDGAGWWWWWAHCLVGRGGAVGRWGGVEGD